MIHKLIEINEKLLLKYKDNPEELQKQQLIQKILKTENCFAKMNVSYAYAILRDLMVSEDDLKDIYIKLIHESKI